jgi:hypothetical protein
LSAVVEGRPGDESLEAIGNLANDRSGLPASESPRRASPSPDFAADRATPIDDCGSIAAIYAAHQIVEMVRLPAASSGMED